MVLLKGRAEEVYEKLNETRKQLVEPLVMAEDEYANLRWIQG